MYDRAIFRTIDFEDDDEAFNAIDSAYRNSSLANAASLLIWEAKVEHARMIARQEFNFQKIKKAARDNPNDGRLLFMLAAGYRAFGDHETAARTFEDAAEKEIKESSKLSDLASAARQYELAGRKHRSDEIRETLKQEFAGKPDLQHHLLYILQQAAEDNKKIDLQVALMERSVELYSDDTFTRFELAYKHGEIGNEDMAFHHYEHIPFAKRSSAAWTNIGVCYSKFQMPINAVEAYRRAEEGNETSAMCNLGFALLGSGFLPEARQLADKAAAIKEQNKRVPNFRND
jgi:tetratricopeptide (TPR) repeat protein